MPWPKLMPKLACLENASTRTRVTTSGSTSTLVVSLLKCNNGTATCSHRQLLGSLAPKLLMCGSYPWAADTLVFADGSAHFTQRARLADFGKFYGISPNRLLPGGQVASSGCLRCVGGKYGVPPMDERDIEDANHLWNAMNPDVLLRRRLPQ